MIMATASITPVGRAAYSAEEWELRVDLAAAYRLCAMYGWDDQLATHISARIPGPEHHLLINPLGLFFEEITASSLIKIDLEGNKLEESPWKVNRAGFVIHSAIHAAREDAKFVVHLHTVAGQAVSAQKRGLLPLSPSSMILAGQIGYHPWEGITVNDDEKPRIVAALGDNIALMLNNHGTLTVGETMWEAFHRMYLLERACQVQVASATGGAELIIPDESIPALMRDQLRNGFGDSSKLAWNALRRKLDRIDESYKN
jgi:ribulose-5-phosphate 4-epimerase/fuculose-1-phosphate aldolase